MPTCPRCHVPLPVPTPAACSSCGLLLQAQAAAVAAFATPGPIPRITASGQAPAMGAMGLNGPRLSARTPDGRVTEYPLGPRASLGRHPANTIRLADREVSKEHAAIEKVGNTYLLKDLESSNGTFVNGRRIREFRLKDGDEISVGNSRLMFHSGEAVTQSAAAPGVTVVATAQSIPAFLAQLDQVQSNEFRPVDQVTDVQQVRQDYEKLRIAHEFHRQVGLERDMQALLDKILKVAFQLLAADNGVIFLVNDQGELNAEAVLHRHATQQEVMLSETVLRRVAETRQAVLTADAILDSRFSSSESIVAQGIRSAMAVPLLSTNQELKGVIFIDTRERTNAFSEKDLKILSGIASQAAIALENAQLAKKIETDAVTRAELSRFLSPKVAEMVVKGQVEMLREGRLSEVSVLFADIRGFTSMSETEEPQTTVAMLNEFFTAMASVVFRHEGNLDKFIGDCVMAVWGEPQPHPDDPARVLRAALEMQREIDLLNERRVASGKRPIQVGIGVNTGMAVVGYMGSQERHEFTAIGDSVNTASRLCGVAKGGEVLAAEATIRRAGGGFAIEPLPMTQVKGKEKGVATYRVLGVEQTTTGTDPRKA